MCSAGDRRDTCYRGGLVLVDPGVTARGRVLATIVATWILPAVACTDVVGLDSSASSPSATSESSDGQSSDDEPTLGTTASGESSGGGSATGDGSGETSTTESATGEASDPDCPGDVIDGWLVVNTQADVDALFNCQSLAAGLYLSPCRSPGGDACDDDEVAVDPIVDLAALGRLEQTAGLWLDRNSTLTSLGGLEALAAIYGALRIENNSELVTIDALAQLRSNLTELAVIANARLSSLAALAHVEHVVWLHVERMPQLVSLGELVALSNVDAELHIVDNVALEFVEPLTQLGPEIHVIDIRGNPRVLELTGSPRTEIVWSRLQIAGNRALVSIDGFDALRQIGHLELRDEPNLAALPSFDGVEGLYGLTVVSVDQVTKLAFPLVTALPDGGDVLDNAGLVELSLPSVESGSGWLRIDNNTALERVRVFADVASTPQLGISVTACPQLSKLDLAGTDRLTQLWLVDLAGLTHVNMTALEFVRGDLRIEVTGLVDLDGFAPIERLENDLSIIDNPMLPQTSAMAFADRLEIGGEAVLENNEGRGRRPLFTPRQGKVGRRDH